MMNKAILFIFAFLFSFISVFSLSVVQIGGGGSGSPGAAMPGICASGYAVQNTTTGGVQCVPVGSGLVNLSGENPFDQDLNTTNNVTFYDEVINNNLTVSNRLDVRNITIRTASGTGVPSLIWANGTTITISSATSTLFGTLRNLRIAQLYSSSVTTNSVYTGSIISGTYSVPGDGSILFYSPLPSGLGTGAWVETKLVLNPLMTYNSSSYSYSEPSIIKFTVPTGFYVDNNPSNLSDVQARRFIGSGIQLTDVCLSNGSNCVPVQNYSVFNFSQSFDQNLNTTANVSFINVNATYLNGLSQINAIINYSQPLYNGSSYPNVEGTTYISMNKNRVLYHLNNLAPENSSYFLDQSGYHFDGTCLIATGKCPTAVYGVGMMNNSMNFSGTQYITSSLTATSPTQMQNMTMFAWVYPLDTRTGVFGAILGTDNGGYDRGFGLANNQYVVQTGSASSLYGSAPDLNQWQFVGVVFNTTDITFYKNGVKDVSFGSAGTFGNSGAFTIGLDVPCGSTCGFKGLIDEVALWNRSLNSTEILAIYNAQKTGYGTYNYSNLSLVNTTNTRFTQITADKIITNDGSQIENLNASKITTGSLSPSILTGFPSDNTYFLQGDGTWSTYIYPSEVSANYVGASTVETSDTITNNLYVNDIKGRDDGYGFIHYDSSGNIYIGDIDCNYDCGTPIYIESAGYITASYKSADGTEGITDSGTSCTITEIKNGLITGATCI